ncbi:organic cation transporter protein-like isoform X2 [Panulirus ornatus]
MSTTHTFDDLLTSLGTGKWNLFVIMTVCFYMNQAPFQSLSGAFLTPQVDHLCRIPEGAFPLLTNTSDNNTSVSSCSYLVRVAGDNLEERLCTHWDFDNSTYGSTLTSEFNLVCEGKFLRPLFNSIYLFGDLFGCPTNGWLSDKYGRKTMLAIGLVMYTLLSNCLSWLHNMSAILVVRFFQGLAQPTAIHSGYSLAMEVCQLRHRYVVGTLIFLPWAFSIMVSAGIAYLIRDWQWYMFIVSLPSLVFLPVLWFLDESPRWLILRGHHDRALQVLQRAARWNSVKLPPKEELLAIMEDIRRESSQDSKAHAQGLLSSLRLVAREITIFVRTKKMRKISLSIYTNFLISGMVYFGLSLGGDGFGTDPFVYMVLSGAVEIPGSIVIIPMVGRLGRRVSNIICYLITGVVLLAISFTPSASWMMTTLALLGKLTISAAYQIVFLHANELFPTEVRTRGTSNAGVFAQVGSSAAPFLVDSLRNVYSSAPSMVFSVASLVAAVVTFGLPETRDVGLPDTITHVESHSLSPRRDASSFQRKGTDQTDTEENLLSKRATVSLP